ncbi:MAG: hypothetical protein CSA34_02155 [Desulfobulbus propionicus]|nr:MAG: hypothetical protein CSA34_02155 [Desulfobulbus propionicus]
MSFHPELLTWAGPPVIGAFIGYLTNRVAIRMLFRPLSPWHLFGVRLPMTPGVIPAKRHDLAASIGEMVGEHLLTSQEVKAAVARKAFQEHLQGILQQRITRVSKRDLPAVVDLVPAPLHSHFHRGVQIFKERLATLLAAHIPTPDFRASLEELFGHQIEALACQPLNEIIDPEARAALYAHFKPCIKKQLSDPGTAQQLTRYLQARLDDTAERGLTVNELLSSPVGELLRHGLSSQAPFLLERLGALLDDTELRMKIVDAVLEGIDNLLDSLGPMGAMARGFFEPAMMEEKITTYLDEKKEDIKGWLQHPEIQDRVSALLQERLDKILAAPVAEVLYGVSRDRQQRLINAVATQLLALLRSEAGVTGLVSLLSDGIERQLQGGELSLDGLTGGDRAATSRLRHRLTTQLVSALQVPCASAALKNMSDSLVDALISTKIGVLQQVFPDEVQQELATQLTVEINRTLVEEVAGLLQALDIKKLVIRKVDSLDLLKLEDLLLAIMQEQFTYINLFGALLGFLIGCANVVVLQLGY